MYIGAKFVYKEPIKKPEEMDFVTDIKEIESITWVFWIICIAFPGADLGSNSPA